MLLIVVHSSLVLVVFVRLCVFIDRLGYVLDLVVEQMEVFFLGLDGSGLAFGNGIVVLKHTLIKI